MNNAGISAAPGSDGSSTDPKDDATIFDINVFSVVRMLNTFLPLVKAAPAGRIVNMSSEVGSFGLGKEQAAVRKQWMGYCKLLPSSLPPLFPVISHHIPT